MIFSNDHNSTIKLNPQWDYYSSYMQDSKQHLSKMPVVSCVMLPATFMTHKHISLTSVSSMITVKCIQGSLALTAAESFWYSFLLLLAATMKQLSFLSSTWQLYGSKLLQVAYSLPKVLWADP